MALDLYIGEDRIVILDGVKDPVSGSYDNSLTGLTFELRDDSPANTLIVSGSLAYVAASNGKYTANMTSDVPLIEGATYWLWIIHADRNVYRRVECIASYHDET